MLGDNGRITHPDPTRRRRATSRSPTSGHRPGARGDDTLTGGDDDDRLFGQRRRRPVDAGAGADHVEGNPGADGLTGDGDGDAVIGGSSVSPAGDGTIGSLPTRARSPTATTGSYGDELRRGGRASDLLLGDNATVLLLGTGRTVVQLADVPLRRRGGRGTSGDDTIDGGGAPDSGPGAPDRVFGQGGDDTVTTGIARPTTSRATAAPT